LTRSTRAKASLPLKRAAQAAVFAVVCVFWFLYLRQSWHELSTQHWEFQPLALTAALLSGAAYWISLALCWHCTHTALGGRLSLQDGLRVWSLSTFARYLPGNFWHLVGRTYLGEQAGATRLQMLLSFSLEQILTLLGAVIGFVLTLPFWPAETDRFLPLLLLLPLGLVLIHPAIFLRGVNAGLSLLKRPTLPMAITYRQTLVLLALYVAPSFFAGCGLYASLAVITPVVPARMPMLIGAFAISWTVGYVSLLTPSGLGVREGALAALLTPVFGAAAATVGSLLSRLTLTLGEVLVVVFWQLRSS